MGARARWLQKSALDAVRRGWAVFPLRPNAKTPVISEWEQRATIDPERVASFWSSAERRFGGHCNIGLATGPSGLIVLDTDVPKLGEQRPEVYQGTGIRTGEDVLRDLEGAHEDLPDTYTVKTPSGGYHRYFQPPGGTELRNTAGDLGWLVDTRAAGGYVVAAGSIVNGKQYEALGRDAGTASLPTWIAEQLGQPSDEAHRTGVELPADERRRQAYVETAVRNEIRKVLSAQEGQRNHTLFKSTAALGRVAEAAQLDRSVVRGALAAAAEAVGLEQRESARTIASGLRAGAHDPKATEQAVQRIQVAGQSQTQQQPETAAASRQETRVWAPTLTRAEPTPPRAHADNGQSRERSQEVVAE